MRKIKIVADSSYDSASVKNADFAVASMKVITAEHEFIDSADLNVSEMVQYMNKYKGKSRSSCPNTNDWIEAFGGADDVFCITITSNLSGSYNSARVAKQIYEGENCGKRVFVIDSLSTGPEMTLIVEKLDELIGAGLPYEQICDEIMQYKSKTGLVFLLKSLRTLANNGRVSPIIAKVSGMLGICVISKASDIGTIQPIQKCRGEKRAIEALCDAIGEEGFKSGKISIGHCQNEAAANQVKKMLIQKYENITAEIHELGGLCSFYSEMGGVLVGFEKE